MCDTCHRCGDRHALGATRRRASMARAGQARCRRRAYSHRRSPTIIPERRQNLATPISWHASPSRANARTRERRRSIHSKAYNALVEGIAADLRDGHIWTKALAEPRRLRSAGIILVRRGGRWVVAEHDRSRDEPDLRGLELLSGDGEEAQAWATSRITLFRGDNRTEAQLSAGASWLLLDEGNPFLAKLRLRSACLAPYLCHPAMAPSRLS